ncbi:hypothetical protein ACI65C_003640 [Semiaphis heraclei]
MPKRGKEPRPSSRHSGGRFSRSPQPPRQHRNDYQIAGSSRSTCDSSSGTRSSHTKDNSKKSNGNAHPGNTSRLMRVVNSPIILTDDDDDDGVYKNLDNSVNILKPDTGEGASIVKHFVPSVARYHMSQSASEKPVFRGPETDVLNELGNAKLKIIKVRMLSPSENQPNDSFRIAYIVEDSVADNRSKDKTHQKFEERQVNFNQNNQQLHYDNDKNYGIAHSMSPNRLLSRDRSLSPRINMIRPPSPPLPYSPERDHYNSDNNMLRRDRPKRSPERNVHDRPPRPGHFLEQIKMGNFSSGPPPEPRSPERFRPGGHNRHRSKDDSIHYNERSRRSRSPVYFDNHYRYNRSMSPNNRPFSPNNEQQLPITPPSLRELSSPLRDRPPYPNERSRRRRTPPTRRDRSRERRRRISPRRRTPPPVRSPLKRKENGKKRPNKNQEARKREAKERKRRSQSKPKSSPQQEQKQQQNSFQQPQPQPIYPPPPPPPPGVVRMPPRPFPPGPMMIPLRPPPFPPPMGAWRPPRPPMQAPPSGWPYPRPRPFYFPY